MPDARVGSRHFEKAKSPLIFDLGICLVFVSLPTLVLLAAILIALGKRKPPPPLATWYAADLFAIVPLGNILPGGPPPGHGSTKPSCSGC
jgi:hypothetical protein